MNSPPDEDEGLHVLRRDEPQRPIRISSATSKIEPERREPDKPDRFAFFTVGRISLVGVIVLFILFLIWSGYLIKQLHREASAPEMAVPSSVEPLEPSLTQWITADMLHVTSISLGNPRLAIVNGKRVAEEDSLEVNTSSGIARLRVMQIRDGAVEFKYGGRQIEVQLAAATPPKPR